MIRSSANIRELALNLAKFIFTLFITLLCGSMLPHNSVINSDVISPNIYVNITLAKFIASSLMMVEDRNK